jgi:hypothetical protein
MAREEDFEVAAMTTLFPSASSRQRGMRHNRMLDRGRRHLRTAFRAIQPNAG